MTLAEDKKSLVKFTTKRTLKKAIQKISEEMINNNVDSNYKIYISHACNEKLAKDIKNIILYFSYFFSILSFNIFSNNF